MLSLFFFIFCWISTFEVTVVDFWLEEKDLSAHRWHFRKIHFYDLVDKKGNLVNALSNKYVNKAKVTTNKWGETVIKLDIIPNTCAFEPGQRVKLISPDFKKLVEACSFLAFGLLDKSEMISRKYFIPYEKNVNSNGPQTGFISLK